MSVPVICFVGRSNTGKTTLIEKLIVILKDRGIKVGTVKHHHQDFEIDREGTDTYRHKKAGAHLSMIVAPTKFALVQDLAVEPPLEVILQRYITGTDLVIVEGYKKEQMPKIEVFRNVSGSLPVTLGDENLLAVVTDTPLSTPLPGSLPVFLRDQTEEIADFVVEKLCLEKRR
jgi:molybdopterin-guanine dinucleotide biosynthesis protein B